MTSRECIKGQPRTSLCKAPCGTSLGGNVSALLLLVFDALTKSIELDPLPPYHGRARPCSIQVSHSREITLTTFGAFRSRARRTSSIRRCPRRRASCSVVCTVVRQTPALDAIVPIGSLQTPLLFTSPAMTQSTAVCPCVYAQRSCGGSTFEPPSSRRRSRAA